MDYPELYFPRDVEWYAWLLQNHQKSKGIYLIFYKLELNKPTMRWSDAVKVALCFGWIDSTVKSLGNGKRQQYFCPRNPKSVWSALNKKYIIELIEKESLESVGITPHKKYDLLFTFNKILCEIRNEKLIIMFILNFLFLSSDVNLENINFM